MAAAVEGTPARVGSVRAKLEEALDARLDDYGPAHRAWDDDDPRWSELLDGLMFISDRSSKAGEYYAYRAAAAATWRIMQNLSAAFNLAGAGTDTLRDHRQSAQMAGYAIITRDLDTIAEHMRALLEDVAHQIAPVEDDYTTGAAR